LSTFHFLNVDLFLNVSGCWMVAVTSVSVWKHLICYSIMKGLNLKRPRMNQNTVTARTKILLRVSNTCGNVKKLVILVKMSKHHFILIFCTHKFNFNGSSLLKRRGSIEILYRDWAWHHVCIRHLILLPHQKQEAWKLACIILT